MQLIARLLLAGSWRAAGFLVPTEGLDELGHARLDEVALDRGLEIRTTDLFSRMDFVPGLGRQNAAIGAAFGLAGDFSDVIRTANNAFILQVVEYQPADSLIWETQKLQQRATLTAVSQQTRLTDWLEGLRTAATIVDNRDAVFQAVEDQPLPQFPLG